MSAHTEFNQETTMQTETELKLTLELLDTRRQLIEAHAQIMHLQHRDIGGQISEAKAKLEALQAEKERNAPA